jgi:hypothetical protein
MKKSMLTLTAAATLAAGFAFTAPISAEARPGGCLKYGAAGAVAGHMVHHGIRGAMAGCAAGMYRRHMYNKQMRQERAAGQPT